MNTFIRDLPKIELHAHLNGSLCTKSIQELGLQIYGEKSDAFIELTNKFTYFAADADDNLQVCFRKFAFMHELTFTRMGLQKATELVVRDFVLDNVIYLELRTTPKASVNMNRREYLDVIIDAMQRMAKKYNIAVKLLVSLDRSQSIQTAEEIIDLAITLKKLHPDVVKGIDLSGNPAVGEFKHFKSVLEKAKRSHLKLALHCAEIKSEEEAQDMLDFGFDRCGHGTFLTDSQLEQCRRQNITIECCLTSNVKCDTVKAYDTHHLSTVLEKNVKAVICTDDCGVFNTTLSREYAIACETFGLSRAQIKELCINAIEASFANTKEKYELHSKVEHYFKINS